MTLVSQMKGSLLGTFAVEANGRTIDKFQTQRTGALLAYLLLAKRTLPRESVAETIWPEGDSVAVRNRLNQAISSLRRQFEPPGSPRVFVSDHFRIGVVHDLFETDLDEFYAAVMAAELEGDVNAKISLLEEAASYYHGPLLAGYPDEWIKAERTKAENTLVQILQDLIALNQSQGRSLHAIDAAKKLEQVRPGISVRVKTTARAHVTDSPVEAAVSMSARSRARIPALSQPMIGRDKEMKALQSVVVESGRRIIGIVGLAGIGKTYLGTELARALTDHFNQMVSFVDASTTSENAIASLEAETDSKRLVVIDFGPGRAEGLAKPIEAAVRSQEGLTVIVLARNSVGVEGEFVFHLHALEDGPVVLPLAALARVPAVAMFVSSAQLVRPDFQLTARTRSQLVQLIGLLGGHPLAQSSVARWARTMTVSQIIDRLESGGGAVQFDRNGTLADLVEDALDQISPGDRNALQSLSAFVSGFTQEQATAVCNVEDVHELLERLQSASLLRTLPMKSGVNRFQIEPLVRLHLNRVGSMTEPVAKMAGYYIDRISSGTESSVRDDETANLMSAVKNRIEAADRQGIVSLYKVLAPILESENRLQEALDLTKRIVEVLPGPEGIEALAMRLRLLFRLGDFDSFNKEANETLRLAEQSGSHWANAIAGMAVAARHHRHGEYEEEERALERASVAAEQSQDLSLLSHLHLSRGNLAVERRQYDQGMDEYRAGLAYARESNYLLNVTTALVNIGSLAKHLDQLTLAESSLLEAVDCADGRHSASEVYSHITLASVLARQGEVDRGYEHLAKARAIGLGGFRQKLLLLDAGAELAAAAGKFKQAAALIGASSELSKGAAGGLEAETRQRTIDKVEEALGKSLAEEHVQIGKLMDTDAGIELASTATES